MGVLVIVARPSLTVAVVSATAVVGVSSCEFKYSLQTPENLLEPKFTPIGGY